MLTLTLTLTLALTLALARTRTPDGRSGAHLSDRRGLQQRRVRLAPLRVRCGDLADHAGTHAALARHRHARRELEQHLIRQQLRRRR